MHDVDYPMQNGFHCWTGLNTGLYHDHVSVNPFVGLHVVPLGKLRALVNRKYDRSVATYAVGMGELPEARDERAFAFAPTQSEEFIKSEAQRLAHLYATVGLAYARSIASYEALLPLLQGRLEMLGGYPESVSSCLYLMGRLEEARDFVIAFREREPRYFDDFARAFLEMMDSGGGITHYVA
jgi:hypothetical protein